MSHDQGEHTVPTSVTAISGAEFRDFYLHHWPGRDWCIEDCEYEIEDEEGNFILPDDASVRLANCGWLIWQGSGGPPSGQRMLSFADVYLEYASVRTTEFLLIEMPKGMKQEIEAFVTQHGGKVRDGVPGGRHRSADEVPEADVPPRASP
jgi:hypothetical protein